MNPTNRPATPGLSSLAAIVLVGALALSTSPPAFGQSRCWTTVGSAGTVDEADMGIVLLELHKATIKPTLRAGTVNVRYNIVATEGLSGGDRIGMQVRYTDNGASAQVVVRLNEINLHTGATNTRISFDSNMFPQAAGAQLQGAGTACGSGSFFNFTANAYYLDVEITKTGISGTPVLEGVNVCLNIC